MLDKKPFVPLHSHMAKSAVNKNIIIEDQIIATEEFKKNEMAAKLNWLRAGVLGANDGIASISGLVIGVAGADATNTSVITLSGVAALAAGAFSMAGGEYTSVSAQRDSEKAALDQERKELADNPEGELRELTWFYEQKGLSYKVAREVAEELTKKDALKAHAEAELGINSEKHVSPTAAAISSFVAFTLGGALPIAAVLLPPAELRIPVTFAATIAALALTGYVAAKIGGARPARSVLRNTVISLATMAITYAIGAFFGVTTA